MQQTQLTEIEEEEEVKEPKRKVLIPKNVSAKQLSNLIKVKTVEVLKTLIKLGERPTSSLDALDDDLVELLANEHNVIVLRPGESKEDERRTSVPTNPEVYGALPTRAPIVAIMGHINHGMRCFTRTPHTKSDRYRLHSNEHPPTRPPTHTRTHRTRATCTHATHTTHAYLSHMLLVVFTTNYR